MGDNRTTDACCSTSDSSSFPYCTCTGRLPAIEKGFLIGGVDGFDEAGERVVPLGKNKPLGGDESRVAELCVEFCRRHALDLDQHLTSPQKAELLAYKVLIKSRLEVAALFSAWFEPAGFDEMRKVTGGKLPFPLSFFIPRQIRSEVKLKLGALDASEVYSEAIAALTAISDRLRSSTGPFFFGSKPSSLDALLFGYLAWFKLAPASCPTLSEKANNTRLSEYVGHISKEYFEGLPAPTSSAAKKTGSEKAGSWSSSGKGQKSSKSAKSEPTAAEKSFRRNSRLWLFGASAALSAYVLLSGGYVQISDLRDALFSEDEEEEGADEGGE